MKTIYNALISCKWMLLMTGMFTVCLTSCNDFLDEKPSKTASLVVTTTDQLQALLNNYTNFFRESNGTYISSTDDYGLLHPIYDARPMAYAMYAVQLATWDTQYLPNNVLANPWPEEYKKIFTANMVLGNIDRVTGSEQDKKQLIADAHFIRAYSYFQLVNTYCLPYTEQNKQELGLPIKKSVSFEEPAQRQTVADVYALIESDLAEALKIEIPLQQSGRLRHWRANTAGVHGFAARYYLSRNDYNQALSYADKALAEHSSLVDYNTEMRYGRTGNVPVNGVPVTINYPYTHDNQSDMTDMLNWKEFLYFRSLSHSSWWYVPSPELLDLYDKENDLRYEYHIVENYSYDRGAINPAYSYPGYIFFFKDRLPSGPTVAEMLLIKAECHARLDQVGTAMNAVNQLRAKRLKPGAAVNLLASTKDEAIRKILEERRREMPFTHRWQDIRRLNNNDYALDDVELTRQFYSYSSSSVERDGGLKTYTLPKNSRRYAAPIPQTEIISSQGVIVQNTY
ncbi:RagB/SusD family nutrient uptake outer membrane protein [Sphingobacterium humi]|nr:RagB/SusD family nutrient uptake outer membrane protein [Sphingobacterium humi]